MKVILVTLKRTLGNLFWGVSANARLYKVLYISGIYQYTVLIDKS